MVALAGSERPPVAQSLVGGGIAPTLVVSASRWGAATTGRLLPRKAGRRRVHLRRPLLDPGEAQAITELAKDRDWDTIVLVTTQVDRQLAERVFRRCGDFRAVASGVDQPWWRDIVGVPLEWLKLAVAETVRRGC